MNFVQMRDALIKHFEQMTKDKDHLFFMSVDKGEMWNTYLSSFSDGTNPLFRERTVHDCSCCRGFIKNIGNVVALKDGKIETIWDFECNDDTYGPVVKAMSEFVRKHDIENVYLSIDKKIGCHHNFEEMEKVGVHRWDHFYLELPDKFTCRDSRYKNDRLDVFRSSRDVLLRSLREIDIDAVNTILELCSTNTLYRGQEYVHMVKSFRDLKVEFDKLDSEKAQSLFAWEKSITVGSVTSRIRNHAIGTLLVNVSEGMELDEAVKQYERITAPANYKRSKPIFTQRMLDDAKKTIDEMGYADSLSRRHANLDDITVNDILFVNRDDATRVKGTEDIFDTLSKMTKGGAPAKKFSKVEEITAETFVNEVLPTATNVEVYVENKLASNFVSLIASKNPGSKSMFKWGNNFSWAYAGNLTDSMKERVKAAGGKVDGDLRFSIQWNEDGTDNCDLDAHCKEPTGFQIFFRTAKAPYYSPTGGQLDVDIIDPNGNVAVENITWDNRKTMTNGTYTFSVHQYSGSVKKGFRAEIEFDGEIYSFDYPHSMRQDEVVVVAEVTLKNGKFSIKPALDESRTSKTIWNVKTNAFVPVSVICYSPNHWSTANNQTGHKHLFFMLKDCINEENPSGMFNEYLVQELYEHRKVMEALGGQMRVESTDDQLSGLGFALDKRAELVVKVTGSAERTLKIKF